MLRKRYFVGDVEEGIIKLKKDCTRWVLWHRGRVKPTSVFEIEEKGKVRNGIAGLSMFLLLFSALSLSRRGQTI